MPDSLADSSIFFRVMLICIREAVTLRISVASTISSDGTTRAGAKEKIWATYSRDIRLLRPVDRNMCSIMLHRELTLVARLASSPEEYFRKKLTGRDRIRIITDASTAWEVFVLIRSISSVRISSIICPENALDSRNTPMPIIRLMLWFLRMVPVTRL